MMLFTEYRASYAYLPARPPSTTAAHLHLLQCSVRYCISAGESAPCSAAVSAECNSHASLHHLLAAAVVTLPASLIGWQPATHDTSPRLAGRHTREAHGRLNLLLKLSGASITFYP